jgi:hypothetical protein
MSTDRDTCLADPDIANLFRRAPPAVDPHASAALAGANTSISKNRFAETFEDALDLARGIERAGLKNGIVKGNCSCRALRSCKLYEAQFFGRILSIRLDFGWWVFDATPYPAQRSSYVDETDAGWVSDWGAKQQLAGHKAKFELRFIDSHLMG